MARIKVIDYEESSGLLRDIYDGLLESRGKLANVHKIHSLHPESLTAHMDLYLRLMFRKSPLRRYQREMIGIVVSKANQCPYCQQHHAKALDFYWKDKGKTDSFVLDYRSVEMPEPDKTICDYAWELTTRPDSERSAKLVDAMKEYHSDRAILDVTMIVGYFNYVNRIVIGLGVCEEDDVGGFNY